ncbi:MAG TPA: hypothetical protein VH120_10295 [Gemmataceae bacterium]|nr:hypothetical protein [Gemmataceae bacterium]
MRAERLDLFAGAVAGLALCHLSAEPGWTQAAAEAVASAVEAAFRAAVRAVDPAADGFCEFCGSGPACIVCGRGRP